MEYIIVDDFETKNLQKKVNDYIKKGYKPTGGINAVPQKDGFIEYLQSMIKDKI